VPVDFVAWAASGAHADRQRPRGASAGNRLPERVSGRPPLRLPSSSRRHRPAHALVSAAM